MYEVSYEVIRNTPLYQETDIPAKKEKYLLYQGSVNEGRSFETLIPAMQYVDAQLLICGDGNFMQQARQLANEYQVEGKCVFKGKILPEELRKITLQAWVGITLFDANGKSNYFSLANRFFDYMQAGIPQLCIDYPVYREINNQYHIAVLTDDLSPEGLAQKLNDLLDNEQLYHSLQRNCLAARKILCWQEEEKKLLALYQKRFN
jgi:glycosyltransferase involved in cell wall biosynthesis